MKQLLPIVPGQYGCHAQVAACFQNYRLYNIFVHHRLTENMRVGAAQRAFSEWLEHVGRGTNMVAPTNDRIHLMDGINVVNFV
uniref:Uncharacterized protein n=1 Tax=Ditylenchus dipsaci TaxID=166011 RepID=A0A915E3V2_9BILA